MAFISKDGYLDVAAFSSLAREIDKYAVSEQMKPTTIHFVPKVMPKYDREKAKAGGELFERKRAQIVKIKKRMPAAGSRMKMVIMLRLYKGIEDTEFDKDISAALKAIDTHNKLAEKTVASIKKEAVKKRDVLAKAFDKNLDAVEKVLLAGGVKKADLAIGQSMMGKSMVVKLPNGGFISIGKADADKFAKAKEPKKEGTSGFGRKKKLEEAPTKKKKVVAEAPLKKKKKVVAEAPLKKKKKVVAEAPLKKKKKVVATVPVKKKKARS
jgi:hypothetical protein